MEAGMSIGNSGGEMSGQGFGVLGGEHPRHLGSASGLAPAHHPNSIAEQNRSGAITRCGVGQEVHVKEPEGAIVDIVHAVQKNNALLVNQIDSLAAVSDRILEPCRNPTETGQGVASEFYTIGHVVYLLEVQRGEIMRLAEEVEILQAL